MIACFGHAVDHLDQWLQVDHEGGAKDLGISDEASNRRELEATARSNGAEAPEVLFLVGKQVVFKDY